MKFAGFHKKRRSEKEQKRLDFRLSVVGATSGVYDFQAELEHELENENSLKRCIDTNEMGCRYGKRGSVVSKIWGHGKRGKPGIGSASTLASTSIGSAFGVSYSPFGSTTPALEATNNPTFGTSINATLGASSTPVLASSRPSPTPYIVHQTMAASTSTMDILNSSGLLKLLKDTERSTACSVMIFRLDLFSSFTFIPENKMQRRELRFKFLYTTGIFMREPNPSSRVSTYTVSDFNVPSSFDKGLDYEHKSVNLFKKEQFSPSTLGASSTPVLASSRPSPTPYIVHQAMAPSTSTMDMIFNSSGLLKLLKDTERSTACSVMIFRLDLFSSFTFIPENKMQIRELRVKFLYTTGIFMREPNPSSRVSADTVSDFNVPSSFDKETYPQHSLIPCDRAKRIVNYQIWIYVTVTKVISKNFVNNQKAMPKGGYRCVTECHNRPTELAHLTVLEQAQEASTRGLMTTMLAAPNEQNRPLYAARYITRFYFQHSPRIFPKHGIDMVHVKRWHNVGLGWERYTS
ncbi:acyl transferase/acyl hydrolase/lysophospholipase [Artemisia annua]|uniref:Acyl transferase/acyl hydrolase/lysophospholipase n=1 Tax=Artemisia annua TaxID=35608 RepID=A0A2U1MEZ3_ARTAN|nr:acyl transferase/acyl hydrolase/lysophospholipase [Artemisia annua]